MPLIEYETKNFASKTLGVIESANEIIGEYRRKGFSLTLRQVYYQFVARGLLANTERNYKSLGNIISDARRAGMIDWNAIEDRTRFLRSINAWVGPQSLLRAARDQYHTDLWEGQRTRVEVWIEKDALVGVISRICTELDVPFFSCRGYVSDSEMWRGGQRIAENMANGQETLILHLGDHDPSGIDMTRDIQDRLAMFSGFTANLEVKRIALTMAQIREQNPPPNPAKVTDSRYEGYLAQYGRESWELDALEPQFIADLINDEVRAHRNDNVYYAAIRQQESDRDRITQVIDKWDELF